MLVVRGVGSGGVSESEDDLENGSDSGGAGGGDCWWGCLTLWREREDDRLG